MPVTPFKVAFSVAAISGVGLSGYGFYYLFHRSMGDRIASSMSSKKKRFLGKGDQEWSRLKDKYNSSLNKPKKEDGISDLSFEELPEWCERNYYEGFSSDKQDTYEKVAKFCFYNTNTLLSNLSGKKFRTGGDYSDDWKQAGDAYYKYSSGNRGRDFLISADDTYAQLSGSSSILRSLLMRKWCYDNANKKMYESGEIFPIFERWCAK
ncbi:hypothetical protein MHF_0698 [Mycoplasma haemofelis Ohio2]|uniref:Uncharacterized protein n=1 Tax=Mycoplasma haemofelis (strain Ohio2) TaxID=859194 RepID=F6FIC0_MYCHI|nr:hypothetical protein MHF_0698 [Mycoplasma haemofelis Ohio2]